MTIGHRCGRNRGHRCGLRRGLLHYPGLGLWRETPASRSGEGALDVKNVLLYLQEDLLYLVLKEL